MTGDKHMEVSGKSSNMVFYSCVLSYNMHFLKRANRSY